MILKAVIELTDGEFMLLNDSVDRTGNSPVEIFRESIAKVIENEYQQQEIEWRE